MAKMYFLSAVNRSGEHVAARRQWRGGLRGVVSNDGVAAADGK